MGKLKVFVGSSGEGEYLARLIAQILADNKIASLGWWETSAFPPGETFVESLHRLVAECNAAIFVATPDDLTVLREEEIWTARGNVLLEYGMFSGVHGRRRVALATADSLTLPSDLKGISVLALEDVPGAPTDEEGRPDVDSRAAFKRSNEGQIVDWADSAKRAPADTGSELFELFPQVADVLVDAIRRVKDDSDPSAIHRDLDLMASDVIGAVAATADASGYLGITESLVEKIQRLLIPTCSAIHAVDVLGPRGWLHPRTYRYLAPQIRRYIESNTDDEGRWRVTVSPTVEAAINLAVDNAKRSGALDEAAQRSTTPSTSTGAPATTPGWSSPASCCGAKESCFRPWRNRLSRFTWPSMFRCSSSIVPSRRQIARWTTYSSA